jgi:hypothetical protein
MKKSQEKLLASIVAAADKGLSLKISKEDYEDAKVLVDTGVCYWSLDYEHISVYDRH